MKMVGWGGVSTSAYLPFIKIKSKFFFFFFSFSFSVLFSAPSYKRNDGSQSEKSHKFVGSSYQAWSFFFKHTKGPFISNDWGIFPLPVREQINALFGLKSFESPTNPCVLLFEPCGKHTNKN